jgi:hypothetical protein
MSANIKASTDGTQAIIGVGGVDQMTVSNASVVTANSFVGLNNSSVTATGSTTARTLDNRFADVVNVKDFGAVGDGVADDTAAFNSAASAANTAGCSAYVPKGNYLISAATTNCQWILDSGAVITGLSSIPTTTYPLQDTSRLTGNVFHLNGKTTSTLPTVNIGSSNHWLTKTWKYVSEFLPKLNVTNEDGLPAAYFSTLVKSGTPASTGFSIGTTTVNNDSSASPNGAWGIYNEIIRGAAVGMNQCGTTIGAEMDIINLGNTVNVTPLNSFTDGITPNLWLSCGGGSSAPLGNTGNDASLAIGIIGNNKKFGRGIVFRVNSINTIGNFGTVINEAIAMPKEYGIAWYDSTGPSSTLDGELHDRTIISTTQSTCAFDRSLKAVPSSATTAGDAIYRHQFWNNDASSFQLRGEHLVIQMENFSGTDSRVAQQWTAKNQGAGFSGFHINFASQLSFAPIDDNTHLLGHPSYRWNTIYCTNSVINTSDARQKQQIRNVSDPEKNVAAKLKSAMKAFKFNEAVEKKGSDKARWHFGVIAQEVKEIFESEGLNAEEYGLFCYDEWDSKEEIKDEKGNVLTYGRKSGNAYGVRYEELLSFLITNL